MVSERETEVELPWAADSCPCVVLPVTVGIRGSVVQLVSTHINLRGVAVQRARPVEDAAPVRAPVEKLPRDAGHRRCTCHTDRRR
jgi:hypothetical protein